MTDQTTPVLPDGENVERLSKPSGTRVAESAKTASESRREPQRYRCSCNAWWTGIAAAHCSGCHRTFTSVSGFATHRKRGACADPEALGMVSADRKWEGWALPGTYTPGDDA